jgi:hypothetical protein
MPLARTDRVIGCLRVVLRCNIPDLRSNIPDAAQSRSANVSHGCRRQGRVIIHEFYEVYA